MDFLFGSMTFELPSTSMGLTSLVPLLLELLELLVRPLFLLLLLLLLLLLPSCTHSGENMGAALMFVMLRGVDVGCGCGVWMWG
jgi:hypothetical protein